MKDLSFFQNIILEECRNDYSGISIVPSFEKNETFCKEAVSINGMALDYIENFNQTVDVCLLALEKDPESYDFVRIVPNQNYETTLKNLKEKKAILEALK